MMIECYFHWCPHHPKDEPFCPERECRATHAQTQRYTSLLLEEAERRRERPEGKV